MEKINNADIDALLKKIQDDVHKQTDTEYNSAEDDAEKINTPDELIDMLAESVGNVKPDEREPEPTEQDDYDISGFEIDSECVEEVTERSVVEEIAEEADEAEQDTLGEPVVADEYADEYAEEAEGEGNNEEEVRKKVEQFVIDTVEPTEDFIFFQSLDRRNARVEELPEESDENVTFAELSEPSIQESVEETVPECEDELIPVGECFEKVEDEENIGLDTDAVRDEYKMLDDSDINFALSLGNKDALELAMGFVKVREAKHNFVNPKERPLVGNVLLENRQGEYKSHAQNADIKDDYRKAKKQIGRRLLLTSFILLAILFCEIVYNFDRIIIPYVSDFLSNHLYYGILSVVLLTAAIAISSKKLFGGVVGFFTANANYYTTAGVVAFINVLYSLLVLIVFKAESLVLMNSVCIFSMVMCIVGEYMQIMREINTFELISDERPKISLERVDISAEMIKKESFLKSNEFYIDNTNFVGRYFERSARRPEIYHTRYTLITLTMLVSLLVAVAAVVATRNFSHFVVALELSAVLCVPVQFVLLGAYQFYLVSKKLYKLDSAIIGETLADEYVGNNTIYLDDVEVFGNHGVKILGLEPYNNFNIIDVNYYFLSVFSAVNGPLKNAFGTTSEKLKLSDNVKLINVFDGGIEAVVDDKNRILAGNAEFLASRGVALGRAAEDRNHERESTCSMFLSVNNALCAKLYLKYTVTHRFDAFSQDMAENRASVGIRTIDPNITEEMIAGLCEKAEDRIKVIRPTLNDLVPIGRRSNSGVITAKNPHMIAKILAEGLKLKKINNLVNILWILYAIIGILVVIATSVFGIFGNILPIYVIAYQMLWTIGVAIYIRNKLRNRKTR